eukprot:7951074-Pyramimonas_sp.AAC.1
MHTSTESQFSVKTSIANSTFGVFNADSAIGLTGCLKKKKEESGPADSHTETITDESSADAAIMIVEEDTSSGAAASGLRAQRHSRPASRPKYQEGRQSYRAAPYAPVPAGPAASGTNAGWIDYDRIQPWAD